MIEVRVRDERVLDDDLLGAGERTADRAAVDENGVVDEECGGALSESFGSIGAEHSDLHC